MSGKIVLGSILSIIGVLSSILGLIFFMGARGVTSRYVVGGVLLLSGASLLIFGIKIFRKGIKFSPGGIRKRIFKLAKVNNGEITEEMIIGDLGDSDDVKIQLDQVVKSGLAIKNFDGVKTKYTFKDFQMKLIMKECPYCGNDYPVRGDIAQCPSCGGDLKVNKRSVSGSDDKFSMDEEDNTGLM